MASLRVSSSRWTFTNSFGQSVFSGFSKIAFSFAVPVVCVDLIVDGQQLSGGELGLVVAAVDIDLQRPLRICCSTDCNWSSGRVKIDGNGMQLRDHQHRA